MDPSLRASAAGASEKPRTRRFASSRGTRESSPAQSRASVGVGYDASERTKPPSYAGGEEGRSRLMLELRKVQRRSMPGAEPEPP
jgi:hypothetical protein